MKELYLLRHAKSDWSEAVPDHDRPLARRGHRAGALIAAYLRDASIHPALVLCSSSQRTRETLAYVVPALGDAATVHIERDLYGAGAADLRARVRAVDESVPSVMLVGHNPGIEDLALELTGAGNESLRARLAVKFPTGALATLELGDEPWRDLAPARARLSGFVVPRELEGGAYASSP